MAEREPQYPELFVALVATLGTSLDPIVEDLQTQLMAVGYQSDVVRLSALIRDLVEAADGPAGPNLSTSRKLMDQGDKLREVVGSEDAAATLALAPIRRRRNENTGSRSVEQAKFATIVRSLKRPEEIELLKAIYGPRLLVIGVSATREERERNLIKRLQEDMPGKADSWYVSEAAFLLDRDQEDGKAMGQRVRKAFREVDAFIWVRAGTYATDQVRRIVELFFGKPFVTPTADEQAMFHAYAAQFRSAAAGRQVGAAITDADGELLVTGTNEVPKVGGGQYWDGDRPDHRDHAYKFDGNERQKFLVVQDLMHRLASTGWLADNFAQLPGDALAQKALEAEGPLDSSRVDDLLEFGRICHAEMAALMTAARRGTSLETHAVHHDVSVS